MRLPDEGDRPLSMNLVPMIDVIFSILAFFILSTLFLVPSEGLDVNLPEASTSTEQTKNALTIGIDATGTIYFKQQVITLENLLTTIQGQVNDPTANSAAPRQNLVVIQADQAVNHGRVVEVMDQLRQIEGIKLAIATVSPE